VHVFIMPPRKSSDEAIQLIPLLGKSEKESLDSPLDRRSEAYRHAAQTVAKAPEIILNVPNILTFARLLFVPVLLVMWEWQWTWSPISCAVVFILASLTDWLDGYLARQLKLATVFGAFLDPVADKIMVSTALILLTVSPPYPLSSTTMVPPVVIMICREVTMSALREWAASAGGAAHKAVKVNSLGKWKTALQMVAMSALLVARQPEVLKMGIIAGPHLLERVVWISFSILWAATAMAVWSLATYMANVWTHFIYPPSKSQ
jgi:CDP-diacylglycerol--glycerol-3-phosphate 3-phosphatidyltransferase